MFAVNTTFDNLKSVITSARKSTTLREKADIYNDWSNTYNQDVQVLEYRAPVVASNSISAHYSGDRQAAVVLDVACGTGLVAKHMKTLGFEQFVGVDGSEGMLELARETGLYQDLKQSLLGEEPLPFQQDHYDIVIAAGAFGTGLVPVSVVREVCNAAKPGGYICLTARSEQDNVEYKKALELELKQLEDEGLWSCVDVVQDEKWSRAVSDSDTGHVTGNVYIYKKQQQ